MYGSEKTKMWFDPECRQSRFALRQLLRKCNRSNKDEDRVRYCTHKRDVNIKNY